jgi:hypothetical protein
MATMWRPSVTFETLRSIEYLKTQRCAERRRVEEYAVGARDEAAQLRSDERGKCADKQSGRRVVNRVRADADLAKINQQKQNKE